jgi:hypothetical protein
MLRRMIHAYTPIAAPKTWMAGPSPATGSSLVHRIVAFAGMTTTFRSGWRRGVRRLR